MEEYKILCCSNCGKKNHIYKDCKEAIISLGIILVKTNIESNKIIEKLSSIKTIDINTMGIRACNMADIENFSKISNQIEFLMIRRKNTLGYIEFMRGRYAIDNYDGIAYLFQQMTREEINKIATMNFEELWDDFWGDPMRKKLLEVEYIKSKTKFEKLKSNEGELGLNFYVENIIPAWDEAEWGFPKGRRNRFEENLDCAKREFEEESGFTKDDYEVLDKIPPFIEEFIGTNGVRYKHIYYIGIAKSLREPLISEENKHQIGEIGAIRYFNYNESIKIIRPYHVARKKLVNKLYMFLIDNIISTAI